MTNVEELLKDWVLDNEKQERLKEGFERVHQVNHHQIELIHKLNDFIEKSPRKPDKLFEALKLPVDRIKVDTVSGSGFKRSFERGGKRFSRPEFVAKDFYESQGYKVTWSEGVAFGMALEAIESEIADRLKGYFKVVPGRIYTEEDIEEIRNSRDISKERRIKLIERERQRPDNLAAGGRGARQVLDRIFNALFSYENLVQRYEEYLNKEIECNCSLSELKAVFDKTLLEVVMDEAGESLARWLPNLDEIKLDNPADKYKYNEWSIAFAKEVLTEMPRKSIYDYIQRRESFYSQCFDLTLFNYTTGEIRFVEVKVQDDMTNMQLMDLTHSMVCDISISLAAIELP